MSMYGEVAQGVRVFRDHQRVITDQVRQLAQEPVTQADSQAELIERQVRLDRAKQYLDFANGVCEEVLRCLTQIQP